MGESKEPDHKASFQNEVRAIVYQLNIYGNQNQFDHIIPADKKFTITHKLTKSLVEIYEEVDKCQLLCGKCHLEKTKEDWLSGAIEIKRKNK